MSESTTDKDPADSVGDGGGNAGNGGGSSPRDRVADLGLDDLDEVADDAGAGDVVDDDSEAGHGAGGGGLSWMKVAVLGVALTFLGFAIGVFVNRDTSPSASSVDVGFYQDMITHHEQALEMSQLVIARGSSTEVRNLAIEVLNFQSYEIGWMDESLQEWGYRRGDRSDTAMAWMGMPVPFDQMPGMATEAQMDELETAEGSAEDVLWLELMAEHHRGGLHMAEYAAEHAESSSVRTLAQRMARNQAIEINEYAAAAERLGLDVTIETVEVPSY